MFEHLTKAIPTQTRYLSHITLEYFETGRGTMHDRQGNCRIIVQEVG